MGLFSVPLRWNALYDFIAASLAKIMNETGVGDGHSRESFFPFMNDRLESARCCQGEGKYLHNIHPRDGIPRKACNLSKKEKL